MAPLARRLRLELNKVVGPLRQSARDVLQSSTRRDASRRKLWAKIAAECDRVTITRGEFRWTVSTGDVVSREVFLGGSYQAEEIASIDQWLRQSGRVGGVVVDVGANIGTTSVPFARRGWTVVAVEPVPAALHLLRENVSLNGLSEQVRVLPAAISSVVGEATMALDGDLGHSELVIDGAAPGFGAGVQTTVAVRAAPLVTLLEEAGVGVGEVALVWSDTQGHEAHVLDTGKELWAHGVPCFVEVWPRGLRSHGGLDRFAELAGQSFTAFLVRSDLLDGSGLAQQRPIADLRALIDEIAERPGGGTYGHYTDVLLIP